MQNNPADPAMSETLARARFASLAMQYLGPRYEAAGEQLGERLCAIIQRFTGPMRLADADARMAALGAAVSETCETTLSLLRAATQSLK